MDESLTRALEAAESRVLQLENSLRREQARYTLMEKRAAGLEEAPNRSYQLAFTGRKRTDDA